MPQSERRGLVLDPSGAAFSALEALDLGGWTFRSVSTVDAACKALSGPPLSVGLVAFYNGHVWPHGELEMLLARGEFEWIALLEEGLLRREMVCPTVLRGFHDFHSLPFDAARLAITLGHAHGKTVFCRAHGERLQGDGRFGMTGSSLPMLQLYRQIEKVIPVDAPVLIGGESGTGKELVSRAIHQNSARAQGPFVAMNCGAIPPSLIHSELFGYERGAFTGASQRKIGNIEAANNGILFLDEIGDLPLDMQANLLRFLQEKTITRVGATERIKLNVRVIAATHVDLERAVAERRFREDLYYRLNVLPLRVPALRERREDIPLLAETVFADNREQRSPQVRGFASEALRAMVDYDWPGNVRELLNRVQHAMIMSENRLISSFDLGLPEAIKPDGQTLGEVRSSVEREVIEASLKRYRNNVSETARRLGVSRVTLYRMIDRLKIVL